MVGADLDNNGMPAGVSEEYKLVNNLLLNLALERANRQIQRRYGGTEEDNEANPMIQEPRFFTPSSADPAARTARTGTDSSTEMNVDSPTASRVGTDLSVPDHCGDEEYAMERIRGLLDFACGAGYRADVIFHALESSLGEIHRSFIIHN